MDASGERHGFDTGLEEWAVLVPGEDAVGVSGRFVTLDGLVRATFRRFPEAPTGVRGGVAVEELRGGEIRQRYTNRLLRLAPDHDPRDYTRSTLTFVGLDGRERTLLADSLVFATAAQFERGRVALPADDRRGTGVYVVRERQRCLNLIHPEIGTLLPETCEMYERSLWHVPFDGAAPRRVAALPTDGTPLDLAVSADARHAVVTLSGAAPHAWVDLDGGTVRLVSGTPARRLALLPDGVTLFGVTAEGLGLLANVETGVRRRFLLDAYFESEAAALVLVPDAGAAVSGSLRAVRRTSVVASPGGAPSSEAVFGPLDGAAAVTHVDALPDGSRVAQVVERVGVSTCPSSSSR